MMGYLLIKVVHLTAVMIWIAGVFVQIIGLKIGSKLPENTIPLNRQLGHIYLWDRYITLPAMILVFLSGPYLVLSGNWIGQKWLIMKVPLIIVLAAVHGMNAGKVRRLFKPVHMGIKFKIDFEFLILTLLILSIIGLVLMKP